MASEFRKLLTVRSTYVIFLVCLGFVSLITFWGVGFHSAQKDLTSQTLAQSAYGVTILIGLLLGLVGILMITHEYRYNTIMYTLTAVRRRWHVLVGKIVVISVFAVISAAFFALIAPFLTKLGLQSNDLLLPAQDLPMLELVANCVFYCWGAAMFGAIISMLVRVQAGAIVVYLMLPLLIENILTLLLKDNVQYLPFTALSTVVSPSGLGVSQALTHTQNLALVLGYIAVGWTLVAVLFSRRDAN